MDYLDNFEFRNRMIAPNNDSLHFYKARIYQNKSTPGDDRIQVRIIPYMEDVPETDLVNLPWYPSLDRSRVIRGLPEMIVGEEKAGLVLVVANSDFTMGYVVCPLNAFPDSYDKLEYNWPYKEVKEVLSKMGLTGSSFNYEFLEVNQHTVGVDEGEWTLNPSEKGGFYLEITNILNGDKVFINSNLAAMGLIGNKVIMASRAGVEENQAQSVITVAPDKITLRARQIVLDYDINLSMGKGGGYIPKVFAPGIPSFTSNGGILFGDPQINA